MTTSNKACLAAPILLDIKNNVTMDQLIAMGQGATMGTNTSEGSVLIQLSNLKGNGISPESITSGLIKSIGFLDIARDLDTELVAGGIVLGLSTGLVQEVA